MGTECKLQKSGKCKCRHCTYLVRGATAMQLGLLRQFALEVVAPPCPKKPSWKMRKVLSESATHGTAMERKRHKKSH